MFDNLGTWLTIAIIIGVLFLVWYVGKRAADKRIADILQHQGEWGDEMCQWLIKGRYKLYDTRTKAIMDNYQAWGQAKTQKLLQKTIEMGDTIDMVSLGFGQPSSTDEKVVTEKDTKFRWIYGVPRQGATYIWFRNGRVTKIKQ